MTRARISYSVKGLDEMIEVMDGLTAGGRGLVRLQEELDGALGQTFQTSQELAHIRTGALKASGDATSDHGVTSWAGTISYEAEGVKYEMQRGGEHSAFIDALAGLSAQDFENAIDTAMRAAL